MTDGAGVERTSPRALIVTLYGLYARETDGWMSVASLVRLMSELGVDETAVRSSISRLKRRGLLDPQRVDGAAGYSLSAGALAVLDEGDRRIFTRATAAADDGWALAVFSVPESEREKRHQLRSRLSWLGFGTVASGVWIAPEHLLDETRDVLCRHGLTAYVDLFVADHVAFADLANQVPRWWDLDRLDDLYDEFLGRYAPMVRTYRRRRTIDERQAFADYVDVLTGWRRLPYLDPGLAPAFLPRDWSGKIAAENFHELRGLLSGPAHRFVESVRQTKS